MKPLRGDPQSGPQRSEAEQKGERMSERAQGWREESCRLGLIACNLRHADELVLSCSFGR